MLVLSRKPMERIEIGDGVFITILEIRANKVRVGIDAPKDIHIRRTELPDKIPALPTDFVPLAAASHNP